MRKATISFTMLSVHLSVRPSVRLQGPTRLPSDGFSWNLIFGYFLKICQENSQVSLKSDNNNEYFTWRPIYIFHHTSLGSSQNKKCFSHSRRGNLNIYFMLNNSFLKIVQFMRKCGKDCRNRQATDENIIWRYVHCMLDQWHTGRGRGFGVFKPPPKFWRPSTIAPNSTQLWKLLKIAEFRTPTHQDVPKKGSKILKLPRFAIVLH